MRSQIAFICIALSALAWSSGSGPNGKWCLDLIVLNGDTIFLAADSSYSVRHNVKTPGLNLQSKADSSAALSASLERFHINRGTFIQLGDEANVVMTKVRSGGRVYPNELDSGRYEMRHDTVVFTIRTRRDYQFALVHDPKRGILHLTDGTPDHMVYQEYRKAP
jgi:hypothetical protein